MNGIISPILRLYNRDSSLKLNYLVSKLIKIVASEENLVNFAS